MVRKNLRFTIHDYDSLFTFRLSTVYFYEITLARIEIFRMEDTYATLHMWTQVVGKIRLEQTPLVNHWVECAAVCFRRAHHLGYALLRRPCF